MRTASTAKRPELYAYENFREFLRDWFAWAKDAKRMTRERFARKAGLKSHTLVGMIIRGERNLTTDTLGAIRKTLELSYSEGLYFGALVRLNQARGYQEQILALAELQSATLGRTANLISSAKNSELYYSDWSVPVLRELLKIPFLPHDPTLLSRMTSDKLSPTQVKQAIEILVSLGYATWQSNENRYLVSDEAFDLTATRRDLVLRNYHCRVLDYTRRAAEEQDFSERELSSICIATSNEKLALVKQRINEFRRELNLLLHLDANQSPDQVILLNTQLLQLVNPTRAEENRHE